MQGGRGPVLSLAEFLGRLAELTLRSQYLTGGYTMRTILCRPDLHYQCSWKSESRHAQVMHGM